jgi:predicted HNH restriction endonuclease
VTWKELVLNCVVDLCNQQGKRTFSLQQLWQTYRPEFEAFSSDNHHAQAKVRQQLQFLREDDILTFLDRRGSYTLKGVLLRGELEDDKAAEVSKAEPAKREYLIETYARNQGWVTEAKNRFGVYCLCAGCQNTFLKPDGEPYIEVHHIIPLSDGGEDSLWNLAVLCAHHHRLAHFAESKIRLDFQHKLLKEIEAILN